MRFYCLLKGVMIDSTEYSSTLLYRGYIAFYAVAYCIIALGTIGFSLRADTSTPLVDLPTRRTPCMSNA